MKCKNKRCGAEFTPQYPALERECPACASIRVAVAGGPGIQIDRRITETARYANKGYAHHDGMGGHDGIRDGE